MMASISRWAGVLFIAGASWIAAGWVGEPLGGSTAWAQSKAIQSQESSVPGVTIEIIDMRRKEGVLNINLRLVNSSSALQRIVFYWDHLYVTAGKQKYLVLRDTKQHTLSAHYMQDVPKGGSSIWWAKFPAPGPEVKKVNFYTNYTLPFEDVPITD